MENRVDLTKVPLPDFLDVMKKIQVRGFESLTQEEIELVDENILAGTLKFEQPIEGSDAA